jgi:hypothetical protein
LNESFIFHYVFSYNIITIFSLFSQSLVLVNATVDEKIIRTEQEEEEKERKMHS